MALVHKRKIVFFWQLSAATHWFHLFHDMRWSFVPPQITWIFFQNHLVFFPHLPFRLGGFLSSELFGFPPLFLTRLEGFSLNTLRIIRFSSAVSRQDWKVFHQTHSRLFGFPLPSFIRDGRFFTKHTEDLSISLLSISLSLEVFFWLISYFSHCFLRAKSMILKNLVFFLHLPTCR